MVCPKCEQKTCVKCMKKYHPNRTCEEAYVDPLELVEKEMSKSIIICCPKCNCQILKDCGSIHMRCPRCKIELCYFCGQDITGHIREHYDKNQCPQRIDE